MYGRAPHEPGARVTDRCSSPTRSPSTTTRRAVRCRSSRTSSLTSSAASRSRSWDRRAAARARCSTSSARSSRRSSGAVRVDDVDPYTLDERAQATFRNTHVGFVFQDHLLLPQLSALDNVLVPTLVATNGPSARELATRARTLLADVGLERRVDHRPGELSGGERQRVAIARALIRRAVAAALRRADRQPRSQRRPTRSPTSSPSCTARSRRCSSSSRTARRWRRDFGRRYELERRPPAAVA